jgi:hypothetical protein
MEIAVLVCGSGGIALDGCPRLIPKEKEAYISTLLIYFVY